MNLMKAFVLGTSGMVNEHQMEQYRAVVFDNYQMVKNIGGRMGEEADSHFENFNNFIESRAWELSTKLNNQQFTNRLGRWDVGVLDTVAGLQNAQDMMRNYIMAMNGVMQGYESGALEGYGGNFSKWCFGTGDENLYYRRQMNGVVDKREIDGKEHFYHKHYYDTVGGTQLTVAERFSLAKTRQAVNYHLAQQLSDFTSGTDRPLNYKGDENVENESKD